MYIRKLWLPILLGVLLTALLYLGGIAFSKTGSEIFSIIFFPYLILLSLLPFNTPIETGMVVAYILLFIQYPIYGIILGSAAGKPRFYRRLLFLIGAHICVSILWYMFYLIGRE